MPPDENERVKVEQLEYEHNAANHRMDAIENRLIAIERRIADADRELSHLKDEVHRATR